MRHDQVTGLPSGRVAVQTALLHRAWQLWALTYTHIGCMGIRSHLCQPHGDSEQSTAPPCTLPFRGRVLHTWLSYFGVPSQGSQQGTLPTRHRCWDARRHPPIEVTSDGDGGWRQDRAWESGGSCLNASKAQHGCVPLLPNGAGRTSKSRSHQTRTTRGQMPPSMGGRRLGIGPGAACRRNGFLRPGNLQGDSMGGGDRDVPNGLGWQQLCPGDGVAADPVVTSNLGVSDPQLWVLGSKMGQCESKNGIC